MLIFDNNNAIVYNSAPNKTEYQTFKPWIHESGVARWIIDAEYYTHVLDGYHIRERTTVEMQAFQGYLDWEDEQTAQAAQSQAQTDFESMPSWVLSGTLAQAETYIDTNVTDLASAKTVLKQMAKLFVLVRDYIRIRG